MLCVLRVYFICCILYMGYYYYLTHFLSPQQTHSTNKNRDNCLLVHQMQRMGTGAMGLPAVQAAKHAAAKHGVTHIVWADAEGGAVVPQSQPQPKPVVVVPEDSSDNDDEDPWTTAAPSNFSAIFQNCPVAMAIATLGGTFVDCNERFCQALNERRETLLTSGASCVPAKTIFNLTAKEDLQHAFAQINDWLTPPAAAAAAAASTTSSLLTPIVLRTAASITTTDMDSNNLRLCLTPIQRPQDKTLRFLCVTLINDTTVSCPAATSPTTAALQPFSFTPLPFGTKPEANATTTTTSTQKDSPAQIKANLMAVG